MRLVLDTNIVVARLLYAGTPNRLLDSAIAGKALCFSSSALLLELRRVLGYPKFARRISGLGTNAQQLVDRYAHLVEIVAPPAITGVVAGDPDDDHVIACAVAAKAELIVSGDRDLLLLESFRDISIVTPADALRAVVSA